MKVVCESCQAKYQLPDERVAGKKLKIRCKRCGNTVLIHGEHLAAPAASAQHDADNGATAVAPFAAGGVEWHVSVDGQNFGPFAQAELLAWLAEQPAGWDSYVWREGFGDWLEARTCNELVVAAAGSVTLAAPPATETEEEVPTRMFQSDAISALPGQLQRASQAPSARSGVGAMAAAQTRSPSRQNLAPARAVSEPRARTQSPMPSASESQRVSPRVRTATQSGFGPSSFAAQTGSSPRMQAARPAAAAAIGERGEDSVLFSTRNLQQVAHTSSQAPGYNGGSQPGYAGGDGSGLIDIRALAALARQNQASAPPNVMTRAYASSPSNGHAVTEYSQGDEVIPPPPLLNQPGAFNRIDSLSPISTRVKPSNSNGVPLAIFGGFAMVAAAAFAAIWITRGHAAQNVQPTAAAVVAPVADPHEDIAPAMQPMAAAVEPVAAPAQPTEAVAPAPAPTVAEPVAATKADDTTVADAKSKKHAPRTPRSAAATEDKKSAPEEKAKEKEKAAPPSLDDVMLADKGSDKADKAHKAVAAPKDEPAPEAPAKVAQASNNDVDDLLGDKPAAKQPAKSRSIDDLLDGAVDKKPSPVAVIAAESLEDSPTREETLSAMKGVEPAVKSCAAGQTVDGPVAVAIQVAGTSGKVTSADVSGAEGSVAACISKAVRNAKFPRFAKPTFAVKFPYRLQ